MKKIKILIPLLFFILMLTSCASKRCDCPKVKKDAPENSTDTRDRNS